MDQLRGYALSSPEMDRLRGLRSQFSDARGDLCKRWTEEATPANRYFPALAKVYTSPIDAMQAFLKWIQLRPWMGLSISNCDGVRGRHGVDTPQGQSIEDDEFGELLIFDVNTTKTKLDHTGQQHDISHWETSYHGTGFYGLGNLIMHGILASDSKELGCPHRRRLFFLHPKRACHIFYQACECVCHLIYQVVSVYVTYAWWRLPQTQYSLWTFELEPNHKKPRIRTLELELLEWSSYATRPGQREVHPNRDK